MVHGKDKKAKRAKLLEMLINAVDAGLSWNITGRVYLTEEERDILRKRRRERSRSQRERELDIAK